MDHRGILRFHSDVAGPLPCEGPGVGDYVYDPHIPPPPGAYAHADTAGTFSEYPDDAPGARDACEAPPDLTPAAPTPTGDVKCFWCCDWFTGPPVGLPKWYDAVDASYVTRGTFCSFNCAAASALDDRSTSAHQSYALLNMMADEAGLPVPVRAAPPRGTLSAFGGTLTTEEFRNSTTEGRVFRLLEFPLVKAVEYETSDMGVRPEFKGVREVEQKLRLFRKKPVAPIPSALERTLQIRVRSKGRLRNEVV